MAVKIGFGQPCPISGARQRCRRTTASAVVGPGIGEVEERGSVHRQRPEDCKHPAGGFGMQSHLARLITRCYPGSACAAHAGSLNPGAGWHCWPGGMAGLRRLMPKRSPATWGATAVGIASPRRVAPGPPRSVLSIRSPGASPGPPRTGPGTAEPGWMLDFGGDLLRAARARPRSRATRCELMDANCSAEGPHWPAGAQATWPDSGSTMSDEESTASKSLP